MTVANHELRDEDPPRPPELEAPSEIRKAQPFLAPGSDKTSSGSLKSRCARDPPGFDQCVDLFRRDRAEEIDLVGRRARIVLSFAAPWVRASIAQLAQQLRGSVLAENEAREVHSPAALVRGSVDPDEPLLVDVKRGVRVLAVGRADHSVAGHKLRRVPAGREPVVDRDNGLPRDS